MPISITEFIEVEVSIQSSLSFAVNLLVSHLIHCIVGVDFSFLEFLFVEVLI